MANTILTPTQVTRKAGMIQHHKLNFVGSINRRYDDSFAKAAATDAYLVDGASQTGATLVDTGANARR
jgi:hypothetical protein